MPFVLQPRLRNALIRLEPLQAGDFEALYAVAADPAIWEQHPSRNRYQREVFEVYFQGALQSGGAFCVHDAVSGELLGSSRYYDHDETNSSICIGYTFIARSAWGRGFNRALKDMMLTHAFQFVDRAIFHVGATNRRSRRAMEKLGARLVGEAMVSYHGEASNPNVVYEITRDDWRATQSARPALTPAVPSRQG